MADDTTQEGGPNMVRITKKDFKEITALGGLIVQRGSNGYWVEQTVADAHMVAHLMHLISKEPITKCLNRVSSIGTQAVGKWYRAVVQTESPEPKPISQRIPGLFGQLKVGFYVVLARIADCDLEIGDVRTLKNGGVEAQIDGGWITVDKEMVDACLVEREFGGDKNTEAQRMVDRLKDYFEGPSPTPEEMREIIAATNRPLDGNVGEFLAYQDPQEG